MNTYGLVMSGGGIGFATHVGVIAALEQWDSATFARFKVRSRRGCLRRVTRR